MLGVIYRIMETVNEDEKRPVNNFLAILPSLR
jgi:hypothetical protein